MTKKVSIQVIADHFGLSLSTISRALNDSDDISPETRRKVLDYAKEVGFSSQRATSIKGKIGILWGNRELASDFLNALEKAFCSVAEKSRYRTETLEIENDTDIEAVIASHKLCGLLALNVGYNSPLYNKLKNITLPTVLVNSQVSQNNYVSCVSTNDLLAAGDAVNYLATLGHTQIAYIGDSSDPYLNAKRFAGYLFGLQTNAIPYRFDLTFSTEPTTRGGELAAEYFVMYNKFFTAALCSSYKTAQGFADSMLRTGRQIPKDLSLITFADCAPTETPEELTFITADSDQIAEQAFDSLKSMLRGFHSIESTVPLQIVNPEKSCSPKRTLTDVE